MSEVMEAELNHTRRLWLFIVLCVLLQSGPVKGLECTTATASCATYHTTDSNNPIPQHLDTRIHTLDVAYTGPVDVILDSSHFQRYPELTTLRLYGKFKSFDNYTFAGLRKITQFLVCNSTLYEINANAFGDNSTLLKLKLIKTDLVQIPTNIFHSLINVQELDLSDNPKMDFCSQYMTSIGSEFRNLTSLRKLTLKYAARDQNCERNTAEYFKPISQVIDLGLSHSGFLTAGQHDPKLFMHLTKLENLSLSDVNPYRKCPRMAKELFAHLPPTLQKLKLHDWKTYDEFKLSCTIDEETLSGLKNLTNLKILEFRYSEMIFGNYINRTLFQGGFRKLEHLDIGWCSFNGIEFGAFKGLNLTLLLLNSNMLGSREFWPFGSESSVVKHLDLSHIGIVANHYSAYYIAKTFPHLDELNLSNNMLQRLPNFRKEGHNPYQPMNTTQLNLRENRIQELAGEHMKQVCGLMPNLKELNAHGNRITTLSDLCISFRKLDLGNNRLNVSRASNLQEIQLLKNLEYLDLSFNHLRYLISNFTQNMVNLQELYLNDNELSCLDQQSFINNKKIQYISLNSNKLEVFSGTLLKDANSLRAFHISYNKIQEFNASFFEIMEDLTSKSLFEVELSGNHFDCSCGHTEFRDWLNRTKLIHEKLEVSCSSPTEMEGVPVLNYTENVFKCKVWEPLKWSMMGLGLILLTVFIAVPCYKYRWYVLHIRVVLHAIRERTLDIKHDDECKYDAMICCDKDSEEDMKFSKRMLQHLEGGDFQSVGSQTEDERRGRVYLKERDCQPGSYKFDELCEVMRQSRKIIIVISNSFLKSEECLSVAAFAGQELIGTKIYRLNRIMVVVLEELNDDIVLHPTVAGLLTENFIEVPITKRHKKEAMAPIWGRLKKFVEFKPNSIVYRKRHATRSGYESI